MEKNMKKTVCVIGLGYVGLPIAVRSVEKGYDVIGYELSKEKVDMINKGKSPIEEKYLDDNMQKFPVKASTDEKVIKKADITLICVPTPVDEFYNPDLSPVIGATEAIIRNLKKGSLVVLESTVNPGVSEEVLKPMFEAAGYKVGTDVFIAHCPERINPGDPKWNVSNIPRVVGSFDKKGLDAAVEYYRNITTGEVRPMKSIREAEAVKILENSFRDINLAFVNEVARSFNILGIDVKDVIAGSATKPFGFMPFYPSCGVGGHCIPVDPYYLIERAKKAGFDHKFLRLSREINNSMPVYAVELLKDALNEVKLPLNGTAVGIMGVAYKANIDDVRESPAVKIMELVKKGGAKMNVFDPHIPKSSNVKTLEEILKKSTALVIATDHNEFKLIDPKLFKKHGIKVIIDGRNCLDKNAIKKLGIVYKGIGR